MKTINLKDFYEWYTHDELIEVADAVAEELFAEKRYHKSYWQRMGRNKSFYFLDVGDGIEHAPQYVEPSPEALYMRKVEMEELCAVFNSLSEAQGTRVDASNMKLQRSRVAPANLANIFLQSTLANF